MAMNDAEKEAMLLHFASADFGETEEFKVVRPVADGKTFSPDALADLSTMLMMFVGGRIMAFHDRELRPARFLNVKVTVSVEG